MGSGTGGFSRRDATTLLALLLGGASPALSQEAGSFRWLPSAGKAGVEAIEIDAMAAEFSRIEREAFSLNFIIYLARFLLNFDDGAASWWSSSVVPSAPPGASSKETAAYLRKRFADFAASVEFGLRRYSETKTEREAFLQRLVQSYGRDQESCRHLALAFSMLQDQPQRQISELLSREDLSKRLTASFSPALEDYMAMDPRRLLPSTQYPVWDGGERRWIVRGLGDAMSNSPSRKIASDDVGTLFGPRSGSLVSQERSLSLTDYALFAASGAAGCSFTHSVVIPLDVVKTRMQTEPGKYDSMVGGVATIQKQEGWGALFLGWQPTILGYMYYGVTVYPGYEFFKRLFIELAGPEIVAAFRVPLVLFAGACSTVVACFGVCPAEAVRIRMVADKSVAGQDLFGVAQTIMGSDGVRALYDGFSTILARQVLFGTMKFFVFDYFGDFLFDLFPVLTQQVETQLLVSLISGATAGVVSSVVSQPADTILSKINQAGGRMTFFDAAKEIYDELGFGGFFLGLSERCVWAGCIISGQFFLYDLCKALLGIKDLRVFLDVQI
jgi:solute carrier family 25 phosphate transporter 3